MLRGGKILGAFALVGALCAGAPAATPFADSWSADPEGQFLLDVNLHRLRLGDGVRAYATPEGTCIVFGDFLAALDVPMKIDLAAKKASGWAFKEEHRISIDIASGAVTYGKSTENLVKGAVRETPEGWCVDSTALARWFGIGVKPNTNGSALILESDAKLPVELAIEREKRAAQIKPAKFDLSTLPQVKLPYRMWRAPALDFVVSGGVTYRANDGVRVDRSTSIYAAGEIAHLSYDARLSTDSKGIPSSLRVSAYRSDPDAKLLGPLKATHFGFGDVIGLDSGLGGSGASGRGAVVTNRPLFNPTAFDKTRFEGDLPVGWEAELYRNGELLAFARPTGSSRYVFEDVQLLYGENQISIVMYGPQGQIRTREEMINVGQENVPKGKTWYWAGANQPGRDVIAFHDSPDTLNLPKAQAAVSVEHGIDDRMSVGAIARTMLMGDERLTFVEGSIRRSIGPALVAVGVAWENGGGKAARAQVLAKFGKVNVSGEALLTDNFHLEGQRLRRSGKDFKLAVDAPFTVGKTFVSAHSDVRLIKYEDNSSQLEAAARLSTTLRRFNLATDVRYRRQYLANGPAPPGELEVSLIGSGGIGNVRLRGYGTFEVAPERRFRAAELSAYWSASEHVDWEGAVAYDPGAKRGRMRVSHIRRINTLALAVTGEAATDGSVAVGFNLNFSLDPNHGFGLSREPLAAAGAVRARVYRDRNDNGVRDPSEPFEKGALITTGTRITEKTTDERGSVLVGGLATFTPVAVGVDTTSLADPNLVPKKALQVVVPRPGVPAEVEIGLVGGGEIEGAIVKNGGLGFEGLTLELVDAQGKVIATTQTDYDGYFLFERAAYGRYTIRVAKDSAVAAKILPDLNTSTELTEERSVARLGSIQVTRIPTVASAQ
ncbi:collagen binding domain-containing protein [Sphingomonas daechungensis]|uniref:collagen binding domain-containing protein n=1 Tax=Sphingomonas daechungensis TaxID=1176646 RepID=UPI003783EDD0